MQKQTTAASPEIFQAALNPQTQPAPSLCSIEQFCQREPAFTAGGIRHLFFTKGHDLPGVHRFGRKILLDPAAFIEGIKAGHTAVIAGRGAV
jgi:hypothetical protein